MDQKQWQSRPKKNFHLPLFLRLIHGYVGEPQFHFQPLDPLGYLKPPGLEGEEWQAGNLLYFLQLEAPRGRV